MSTTRAFLKNQNTHGAAILLMVLLFTLGSLVITIGIGRGAYEDLVMTRTILESRQSFYAAESGIEDAIYRHLDGRSIGTSEVITVASSTATTTITTVLSEKRIVAMVHSAHSTAHSVL